MNKTMEHSITVSNKKDGDKEQQTIRITTTKGWVLVSAAVVVAVAVVLALKVVFG